MTNSRLECLECGYTSDTFGDSRDLFRNCYSLLFQQSDTKEIVVKEIPASALAEYSIDLDSPEAAELIQKRFASDKERFLKLPLMEMPRMYLGVPVDVECPQCGASTLQKMVVGLQ